MQSRTLNVRLPDDYHEQLAAFCDEHGTSKATAVKVALLLLFRRKSIPKQLLIDAEATVGNPEWSEGSESASDAGKVGGKLGGRGRGRRKAD